jgi:endonuclease-3
LESLAAASPDALAEDVRPTGFYRVKAKHILETAQTLLAKHNGELPSDIPGLTALPGVGRKTANLVLIEAFDLPGICVDVHVHRISNRCGWLSSKTPEETEMILREILPSKYWKSINALLVLYGQKLCRPVSPFCSHCVIKTHCAQNNVPRSR